MKFLESRLSYTLGLFYKLYSSHLGLLTWEIAGLILVIAFLYSSVGFGGATGYLAAMALFEIPNNVAVSAALVLNLVVAGISFVNYSRSGHFKSYLLLPFVLASIPAAFIGGTIQLEQFTYLVILHSALLITAIRMMIVFKGDRNQVEMEPPSFWIMLLVGTGLGLLSGMIGIGGGIFLSPLIILAKWGNPKHAAATAAGFIFLNSLSGVFGRVAVGSFEFGLFGLALIPIGVFGSLVGSGLGAKRFSGDAIKRLLGVIILIIVIRFVLDWFFL